MLQPTIATASDARRISEIHMAAFADNQMLLAQFPSPEIRQSLRKSIERKALDDIADPKTTVLVVKDHQAPEDCQDPPVIAFAKWSHPISEGEDYEEPPWFWPEGTDMAVLDAWTKETENVYDLVIGTAPCYSLSFIGTDPAHERRGAGKVLVDWGVQQSKVTGFPLYLESTLEAVGFYKKFGFFEEAPMTLQYVSTETQMAETYREAALTFRPEFQ